MQTCFPLKRILAIQILSLSLSCLDFYDLPLHSLKFEKVLDFFIKSLVSVSSQKQTFKKFQAILQIFYKYAQ